MLKRFSLLLSVLVVAVGLAVAYTIVAYAQDAGADTAAQESAARGITFPVPELGNCGSKEACKTYCNNPANIEACTAFAEAHGLMNKDEAARAKKFSKTLQSGGGPGGCTSPESCKQFCSDVKNIEACVTFAEKNGIKDKNTEQAQKLSAFLKSGGQTPGGCASKEQCEKYCGDFAHAEECFNFAKKAGIAQGGGGPGGEGDEHGPPSDEKFQKFLELAKNGQTPGGCSSKESCESYCKESSHREECTAFAEKAGFVNSDQAQKIRQNQGAGPGGCDSPQACHAYCADESHQEECYKFAEERGFISKQERQEARQGQVSLRAGLDQMPPEVRACLESTLDPTTLSQVQSGNITPNSEIGSQVGDCFKKFNQKNNPADMLGKMPGDIKSCAAEKLGDEFQKVVSGEAEPTPAIADAARVCFESKKFIQESGEGGDQSSGSGQQGGQGKQQEPSQGGPGNQNSQGFGNFIKSAPPGLASCFEEKLGDQFDTLKTGNTAGLSADAKTAVRGCMDSFNSKNQPRMQQREKQDSQGGEGEQDQNSESNFQPPFDPAQGKQPGLTRPQMGPNEDGGMMDQQGKSGVMPQKGMPMNRNGQNPFNGGQPFDGTSAQGGSSSGGQGKQQPVQTRPGQFGPQPGGQFPQGSGQQFQNGGQFRSGEQQMMQPGQFQGGQQMPSGGQMSPPPGGSTGGSMPPSGGSMLPPPTDGTSGGSMPPSPGGSGSSMPPPPPGAFIPRASNQASILGTLLGPILDFLAQ